MIRHIVMWQINNSNKTEIATNLKNKLMNLENKIPELIKIQCGINSNENENYDFVLICDFKSMEDLKIYANHPLHLEVVAYIKENTKNRVCVDYQF